MRPHAHRRGARCHPRSHRRRTRRRPGVGLRRILLLGRGGAGKTTLARRLGEHTGLPVVHLDDVFWTDSLEPLPPDEWRALQTELADAEEWILDGDLGPYDDLEPRLRRADTVVLLDFGVVRCTRRVLRRGRERADFWRWMIGWPWRDRARIMRSVGRIAPAATLVRLRRPSAIERWVSGLDAPPAR